MIRRMARIWKRKKTFHVHFSHKSHRTNAVLCMEALRQYGRNGFFYWRPFELTIVQRNEQLVVGTESYSWKRIIVCSHGQSICSHGQLFVHTGNYSLCFPIWTTIHFHGHLSISPDNYSFARITSCLWERTSFHFVATNILFSMRTNNYPWERAIIHGNGQVAVPTNI